MAFDIKSNGGYGTGAVGNITNPTVQINSYANVTACTPTMITIGAPANGGYGVFSADQEIMVHVSATNGTSTDTTYLGRYMICKITAVSGSVLTVNNDFTQVLPIAEFAKYQIQAVTIAQFANLTLSTGVMTAPAYNVNAKYGGILAIKCSDTLTFSGGSINMVDKGIPVASKALRPWTTQESTASTAAITVRTSGNGVLDADTYAGWENHITARQLLLNAGDGVIFCVAKKIVNINNSTTTRIGGTAAGVQYSRGASDSVGYAAGTTNIGGSTILLACDSFAGFVPSMVSKIRVDNPLGQGLGRCYIASNTKLKADEGLYAYDVVSDPLRMIKQCNIKGYGTGRHGAVTVTPSAPLNNYVSVTDVDATGKVITYDNITTDGLATFDTGSTVMVHVSKPVNGNFTYVGRFMLAKIMAHDNVTKKITINTSINVAIPVTYVGSYKVQLVSVFEPTAMTVASQYTAMTAWNESKKLGGICAIAAKTNIDLSGGGIIATGKGGRIAYAENDAYAYLGQSQSDDILPLGSNDGAIFLLTPLLKCDDKTRIGHPWSGASVSGYAHGNNLATTAKRIFAPISVAVMIIADTINGLWMQSISTGGAAGGAGGFGTSDGHWGFRPGYGGAPGCNDYQAGGAGYGGAGGHGGGGDGIAPSPGGPGQLGGVGGVAGTGGEGKGGVAGGAPCCGGANATVDNGGGGGGGFPSGFCFIYCNRMDNENTTGVIV